MTRHLISIPESSYDIGISRSSSHQHAIATESVFKQPQVHFQKGLGLSSASWIYWVYDWFGTPSTSACGPSMGFCLGVYSSNAGQEFQDGSML